MNNRDYVIPDDIKMIAPNILRHRLILSAELELEGINVDQLINELLLSVEAPRI